MQLPPALNGSSTLERFKCRNGVKISNGGDFYPGGLPHLYVAVDNLAMQTIFSSQLYGKQKAFSRLAVTG